MADFVAAVMAHESDFDRPIAPGAVCFKCRKGPVETVLAD